MSVSTIKPALRAVEKLDEQTAKEVRATILRDSQEVIRLTLLRATSHLQLRNTVHNEQINKECNNWLLETLKPMVVAAGDIQKITANSTADVIKAVCAGKLTFTEGQQLITLLKAEAQASLMNLDV